MKKLIKESLNEFLNGDEGEGQQSEYSFAVIGLDVEDAELQDLAGEGNYNQPHDIEWFHSEQEANKFYERSNISKSLF
ncbi:MAG: hypothetical protein HC831_13475 [Chloroflexia bacterium]|nr:hypothetical protein [Chloroflexia bacterium]